MKRTMKKFASGMTLMTVLSLSAVPAMATTYPAPDVGSTDVNLVINGETVGVTAESGAPYITTDGRTMIPLRLLNTTLGYVTEWRSDGTVTVSGADGAVDVTMQIGANNYIANGQAGVFETAPVVMDGRTYLPARDLMELYGTVEWDGSTRTVTVTVGTPPVVDRGDQTFRLNVKDSMTWPDPLLVYGTNEKTGETATYTVPDAIVNLGDPTHLYIDGVKVIDGQTYLGIGYGGVMSGFDLDLFAVPEGDEGTLTYVGTIPYHSDYTVVNDYLYYTNGRDRGPWSVDPHALYLATVGDSENVVELHVGEIDINRCVLSVEDGRLIATALDGTAYDVANVPSEPGAIDPAHMQMVLEADETLEGFLENDDTLTYEEIRVLPGAVSNPEFGD